MTTQADHPATLADGILEHSPALDQGAGRVALATYRALRTGRPVGVARIAADAGIDVNQAELILTNWPGVFRDDERRIVGFWGLSVAKLGPHRLHVDDVELTAWCAWDTLFLPELLGRSAEVRSHSPLEQTPVRLRVSPSRVEQAPDGLMVSMVPAQQSEDLIRSFCHHIHFFPSPAEGHRWIAERDGGVLLTIEDAFELGRLVNRARYGSLLTPTG